MNSEKIIGEIYKQQAFEIKKDPQNLNWNNIIDQEEQWVIDNCPELYIIEKASNELQTQITALNIEKDIITKIITLHDAKYPSSPIPQIGLDAIRIVYHNRDFEHSGTVSGPEFGLITSGLYSSKLNILSGKIHRSIVDDFPRDNISHNKQFLIMLSLSFGQGEGGHFGLVLGELDKLNKQITISIVDPYAYYTSVFQYLVEQAFERLQNGFVYNPVDGQLSHVPITGRTPAFDGYTISFQAPITTNYLESVSRDPSESGSLPVTAAQKYSVQSYWGQDHFCFMWCIFFAHNFIINRNIADARTLYQDIVSNTNINLVIIKTYILQLFSALSINPGSLFKNFFKNIWTCYQTKGFGPEPPKDQTRSIPRRHTPFEAYEIEYTPNPDFLKTPTVFGLNISKLVPNQLPALQVQVAGVPVICSNDPISMAKTTIFTNIPIQMRTSIELNLAISNSVFRLVEFLLKSDTGFIHPDFIYQTYSDNQGDLNILDCSKATQDEIDRQVTLLNLEPKMKKIAVSMDKCNKANLVMASRNIEYDEQRKNIICDPALQTPPLRPHQQKAVTSMLAKSINRADPGLLVWFGTGTGKTLTANTIAKITTICRRNYMKCFIISTKSVYKSFADSLSTLTKLTPDPLLPNPTESSDQDGAYFARHDPPLPVTGAGAIGPTRRTRGTTRTATVPAPTGAPSAVLPPTDIYVFSSTRFELIAKNADGRIKDSWIPILSESLFILDEAHKVVNIENKVTGDYLFYNSCCQNARQVMLLTATPMVNSPCDIEPLLALINKGMPIRKNFFKRDYVGNMQVTSDPSDVCESVPAQGSALTPAIISSFNIHPLSIVFPPFEKISISQCLFDLSMSTTYTRDPTYNTSSAECRDKFENRIVYAMPTGDLPAFSERKFCISTNNISLIQSLVGRETIEVDNITTSQVSSFGSGEFLNKNYSEIKYRNLFNIIRERELTDKTNLISHPFNTAAVFDPKNIKFKYVIYSQQTKFLNGLKKSLTTSGIDHSIIGEIMGETSSEKRASAIRNYNAGKVKILLITDAAVEGVDLRRTAMVILAEPVWTKAKYDQIIGRGVRDSSGERLKDSDYEIIKGVLELAKSSELLKHSPVFVNSQFKTMEDALAMFKTNNIKDMHDLFLTANIFVPYVKDKLDFSEIPNTIDCMTCVLSYSMPTGVNTFKFSIDTYKYNAMRVKFTEMQLFYTDVLSRFLI